MTAASEPDGGAVEPRGGVSAGDALPDRLAGEALADLWLRCWRALARGSRGERGDWRGATIRVPLADDAQRRAVAGLLGRPVRVGTGAVRVHLGDLDDLLDAAGDGWDLLRVVEAVHGPLPDRVGQARAQQSAVADACRQVTDRLGDRKWVTGWLDDLRGGMLARLHGRGELDLVVRAADVLARLPADGTPMPVLAAAVTGDTKALAGTTLEGLVLRALALRFDEGRPADAGARRALWEAAGVVPDDLASQVLVLGLPVAPAGPLGGWLHEAAAHGWPFRATLHQLARSSLAVARPGLVRVCENPAVLRASAERLGADAAPLVCTEGRPSVACLRLLRTLREAGCRLAHHGDFDWAGLRITATVVDELGALPWRMGAADYLDAVAGVAGERPPLRGSPAASPWDPDLAVAMAAHDRAVYEEDVLDHLVADLAR